MELVGADLISATMLTAFLTTVFASAMPLALAATGETVGEQAGMLNIGIDGLMLVGGFFGFMVALETGSAWWGMLGGLSAGMLLSTVMVVLCVWLGLNQIVVGIGIGLAGAGTSSMLYEWAYGRSKPRLGPVPAWEIPLLSELPVVGRAIFAQPGVFTLALLLLLLVGLWLRHTVAGLRLRAAGQSPGALDTAGGNVRLTRAGAVLFGGAMSGLGGAYLALISAGTFTPGMTHGIGFLAIVVAMLARGRVRWVLLIALGYGVCIGVGTVLQLTSINLPIDVVRMLPFIAVMAALILVPRGSVLPPALARPYLRGER